MSPPKPVPPEFGRTEIQSCEPCKAYVGVAGGLMTFNGIPVLLIASTAARLVDAMKEINPAFTPDPKHFERACLMGEAYVKRRPPDDDEL